MSEEPLSIFPSPPPARSRVRKANEADRDGLGRAIYRDISDTGANSFQREIVDGAVLSLKDAGVPSFLIE
jgi:hypothetical protein